MEDQNTQEEITNRSQSVIKPSTDSNTKGNVNIASEQSDTLCNMYFDLIDDLRRISSEIDDNNSMLKEIEIFLKTLISDEDNDLKVFSPRNPANLYSQQILEQRTKQSDLEAKNRSLYKEKNILEERIATLKKLIDSEGINIPLKKQEKNSSQMSPLESALSQKLNSEIVSNKTRSAQVHEKNELAIQENEKRRIARDLHDTTVQNLTHSIHMLELASKYIDLDPIRAKLELSSISKCIKETIDEMRDIIYDLRPMTFDDIGFTELLNRMQFELQQKTEMKIEFEVSELDIIDDLILITLYRVIKECCWNAIKHSKGKNLLMRLHQDKDRAVDILIQDDGVGIGNTEGRDNSYGLSIVKERISILSGTFMIDDQYTKGTKILIHIPVI